MQSGVLPICNLVALLQRGTTRSQPALVASQAECRRFEPDIPLPPKSAKAGDFSESRRAPRSAFPKGCSKGAANSVGSAVFRARVVGAAALAEDATGGASGVFGLIARRSMALRR